MSIHDKCLFNSVTAESRGKEKVGFTFPAAHEEMNSTYGRGFEFDDSIVKIELRCERQFYCEI